MWNFHEIRPWKLQFFSTKFSENVKKIIEAQSGPEVWLWFWMIEIISFIVISLNSWAALRFIFISVIENITMWWKSVSKIFSDDYVRQTSMIIFNNIYFHLKHQTMYLYVKEYSKSYKHDFSSLCLIVFVL